MKTLFALLLVAGLGALAYMFLRGRDTPVNLDLQQARSNVVAGVARARDTIQEKLPELSVRADEIKEELARSGKVVREKARSAGAAIADAAADTRITAAIKAKLVTDPELSALEISVNTTAGVVTLAGRVSSEDHVARAMNGALAIEGVREVISTLQVRRTE